MAVDDFLSRDTETFVLPSKSFFPLKIPIAHYQLRHFISAPDQDLLYYASGSDVYCLNTATKTQAHVTTLPWEARCTASGYGYVCVGGAEEGNFAAIEVAGFPPADPADVDALLPLDLASRVPLPRPPLLGAAHRVRLEKIGVDIVNSISIHKFPAEADGQDEVVAVLTNNDKTVRIYSLTLDLEVSVLDLPFPMNHATISPDGQLLVAVGDKPVGFFFKQAKPQKPRTMKSPEGRVQVLPPEWALYEEVRLYVPPDSSIEGSSIEGYFTTAWSPSGRLCAVGSECGYITVFDIDVLKSCEYGEDAIVHLISSSRPGITIGPGAVRTMQFSPAPWDFLIWSEDQARVCVADLRSGLKIRQILTLDPKEDGLEKVEIADFDLELSPELRDLRREADFIRRYRRALDSEGTAAAVNFANDYIEASSERRRLHRRLGVVESDNDPHGLTAHERQILDALRTTSHERQILEALRATRQREEAREQGIAPRSINYNTPGSEDTRRYGIASQYFFPIMPSDNRHRDALEARAVVRAARELESRRNIMADMLSESHSNELQARSIPRRQPSVVLLTTTEAPTSNPEVTANITDAVTTRSPNPIPAHARRVDAQIISSTDEAWRTIEEALARNVRAADNVRPTGAPELRTELRRLRQLTQMRERLRNARESQPHDPYSLPSERSSYHRRRSHDPTDGVRTAGLAMSQDGRTLYCGTEEGIFEFHINLHERKGIPAIKPR
ncbi:uncharacterized protein BDR25DRAFT_326115 [Lindgomyces ingoldianus]|uniref:Uncharacterized protein n=1 Tax=Lindgomyces ingoldianus TaxID=673940 RepID=A0ACB6QT30_9PLEO|nr:uncharacterized protein BDR25DRAFT_326115 [Lindgomyces ingoldianus]KAF2469675.1 hypothetical protein BDR25DRAFT_326115 [Lindgomyces ingoldianus]